MKSADPGKIKCLVAPILLLLFQKNFPPCPPMKSADPGAGDEIPSSAAKECLVAPTPILLLLLHISNA